MKHLYFKNYVITLLIVSFAKLSLAQTNPAPQLVHITNGYTQNFNDMAAPAYPAGWQGWTVVAAAPATAPPFPAAIGPRTQVPGSNIGSVIDGTAASVGNGIYNYSGKIGLKSGNSSDNCIVVALNTTSATTQQRVKVKFDAMVIRNLYGLNGNNLITMMVLQYRIGDSGNFINVGNTVSNGVITQSSGTNPVELQNFEFVLPEECSNKPILQLRWILGRTAGSDPSSSDPRPSYAIDNFSASIIENPMPVDLTSFIATKDINGVKLSWTTLSEKDNHYFEIYHSTGSQGFNPVIRVEGNGTTNTVNNYTAYHNSPAIGLNYYKIIQFDYNGKSDEKGLEVVNYALNQSVSDLKVYPNPTQGVINIALNDFNKGEISVQLANMQGKVIYTEQLVINEINESLTLDLKGKVSVGQYIIKIKGDGLSKTAMVQFL
jgi:hypothetical protein